VISYVKIRQNLPMTYYTQRNTLRILIDPLSIHLDASHQLISNQVALTMMLHYLPVITDNKIKVEVVFPKYLWDESWKENYLSYVPADDMVGNKGSLFTILKERSEPEGFVKERSEETKKYLLSKKDDYLKFDKINPSNPEDTKRFLKYIEDGTITRFRDADYLYNHGYLELIDTYFQSDCDLLLSSNHVLLAEKSNLNSKFRFFAVNYPEVFDEVETFLKGHHIYITHKIPIYGLQMATFYPMTEVKLQQYLSYAGKLYEKNKDPQVQEYFRVMLYHRYSFMRYAIDQIKFNMFQAERLEDDKLRSSHYFLASYHLNSFYVQLWGFLDNFAWVLNHLFELGFDVKSSASKVSFSNKKYYMKKLKSKAPELHDFLTRKEFKDWIDNLSDKRHPAAHREPLFMSPIYNQDDMSIMSEKMVVVNTKKGRGMFDAVNHLKYDFEQLEKFMDGILKILSKE
jgi:hypothetical protein